MLTVSAALSRVLGEIAVMPSETVPLAEAFGRVLAQDVVSPVAVPPWDNSAMDGYAVRAADTADGEVELVLHEVIAAGGVGTVAIGPGTASAIMTGAPVPAGADAVVMVEHTDGSRQGAVRVTGRATAGQHIRRRGEAIGEGDVVLERGTTLSAAQVAMAASVGQPTLRVARRPVVAVLSTGDEVVMPGTPLAPGQIWSSNNIALVGMIRDAGAVALDLGNAPDDLDATVAALDDAIARADVVLTTGGVSVGAFDLVKPAYERLGASIDFWKVQMKPGKPLALGRARRDGQDIPLFGLPGNPVSCMVNFLQFVRPYLRLAMGSNTPHLPVVHAVLDAPLRDRSARVKLVRVKLRMEADGLHARSTGTQSSGVLTSMALADGLAILSADQQELPAGATVPVQLLDSRFLERADPPSYS